MTASIIDHSLHLVDLTCALICLVYKLLLPILVLEINNGYHDQRCNRDEDRIARSVESIIYPIVSGRV